MAPLDTFPSGAFAPIAMGAGRAAQRVDARAEGDESEASTGGTGVDFGLSCVDEGAELCLSRARSRVPIERLGDAQGKCIPEVGTDLDVDIKATHKAHIRWVQRRQAGEIKSREDGLAESGIAHLAGDEEDVVAVESSGGFVVQLSARAQEGRPAGQSSSFGPRVHVCGMGIEVRVQFAESEGLIAREGEVIDRVADFARQVEKACDVGFRLLGGYPVCVDVASRRDML